MIAAPLVGDQGRISLGLGNILQPWQDHRYIFAPGISLLAIEDGATIEPSRAPLRNLTIAPPGKRTSRIIKIGGTVGGSGGVGGWFSSDDLGGPGVRTFWPGNAITNKDDLELELQRIANMVMYRGLQCMRFGNADDRFIVVGLKAVKADYVEGTDRNMINLALDFEAVEPSLMAATPDVVSFATLTGNQIINVGGSEPTWPRFYLATSNVKTRVWVGVVYSSLPGSPMKVVAYTTNGVAGFDVIYCDPRRRGIWTNMAAEGLEYKQQRDDSTTASMNCQDTVGDNELMPYLMPGLQHVFWSTTSTLSGICFTGAWNKAYAF